MPKNAKPLPQLTDEQRAIIESNWYDPPDVLLHKVWPDNPELTLRTVHWKALRAHLATIGKDPGGPGSGPQGAAVTQPTATPLALTTAQEEFITASYKDAANPTELARILFNNPKLHPGSAEVRLVLTFIRKIDPTYRKLDEMVDEVEYQPPKNIPTLVGRLNRYSIGTRPDGRLLGDGGYSAQETRQLEAVLRYMRRPAFKVEAESFTRRVDREVFEETFMSFVWDKPDLTSEHVLQYLQLASVTVRGGQAQRTVDKLTERFNAALEDPTQRLGKAEVDALKNTADKTSEYLRQMNTLIKTLTGERAKIVSERLAGSSSMHPLVEAWRTKEGRERIMKVAAKYRDELRGEVIRLSEMDQLKVELFGLDPEQIVL